ncbi:MAG: hypothetical protein HY907_07970 [Deltaproteobacteria bacterium]|nr:hypothetical protein [Deltaproteobacteria bacterium]
MALLALAPAAGCNCQGVAVGTDDEVAADTPRDGGFEAGDLDADAGSDADSDAGPAADADTGTGEDGGSEAEAWPDAPSTCEWYEMRSAFDGDCGGYGESWVRDPFYAPGDEPVLRVVSVYEPATGSRTGGPIRLHLRRTYRPVVLVLGAYESVEWVIERDEGARLERIFVYGYDAQEITGADDVPVTNHSPGGDHPGICWPFCSEYDTRSSVERIEAETGLAVRTFDGCYNPSGITLGDVCREECRATVACAGRECGWVPECRLECGGCPPGERCGSWSCSACAPSCSGRACGTDGCGGSCGSCGDGLLCDGSGACVPDATFPGCADVTAESHYCLTVSDRRPALLGLDSGTVCPFGKPDLDLHSEGTPDTGSIGWLDGSLLLCIERTGLHGLVRYDVLADVLTVAPVPCSGLAVWRDGMITEQMLSWGYPEGLTYFTSFDDALDGVGETWPWAAWAEAMTSHEDLLYWAGRGSDGLEVRSLPSGEVVRTITLDYDVSLGGMSVTDDGLLVIASGWREVRVTMLDEATGTWLRDVVPTAPVFGLACFVGP